MYVDDCVFEPVDFGGDCPECPECPECPTCPPCEPGTGECDEDAIAQAVVDALRDWFSGLRFGVVGD